MLMGTGITYHPGRAESGLEIQVLFSLVVATRANSCNRTSGEAGRIARSPAGTKHSGVSIISRDV